jgi:hypothetical protein
MSEPISIKGGTSLRELPDVLDIERHSSQTPMEPKRFWADEKSPLTLTALLCAQHFLDLSYRDLHALCWSTALSRIFALPAFIQSTVAIVEIK